MSCQQGVSLSVGQQSHHDVLKRGDGDRCSVVRTFRRQPLDVCVMVICRFITVLRVEGWQGTSRTMWSGSGAVSDDDVHMSVTVPCDISFETYFWCVFRAWPKNLSRSVWKLLAFYGCASVASAINANICTGFMVLLAIQHSHIFVGETSKGLSSKRLYFVAAIHRSVRYILGRRAMVNIEHQHSEFVHYTLVT